MKYRIKNPEFEKFLRSAYKDPSKFDKDFEEECDFSLFKRHDNVIIRLYEEDSITGSYLCLSIPTSQVEKVKAYNPNGWNKYPDVRPPKEGLYLVTTKIGTVCTYHYSTLREDFPSVDFDVAAFRELPEPYKE